MPQPTYSTQHGQTNTIYLSSNRGPPGVVSSLANAGAFEPPYQHTAAAGKHQDFYSMWQGAGAGSGSTTTMRLDAMASPTSQYLALGVYPNVNGDSCRNCLYTLAQVSPALSECLRFEPETATGAVIPMAAKNTPECQRMVTAALKQCVANCAI